MKTIKIILSTIKTYIVRFLFSLVNRDYNRPIKLTKEEELYSFLEENKNRLQYLMYQRSFSNGVVDPKDAAEMRNYNEDLKEKLKLEDRKYKYIRPLWISAKMKKFLKNDEQLKNDAFKNSEQEIENISKEFQELQEGIRVRKDDKIKEDFISKHY
tara:strand:+ start:6022 stop:6489 length:468 start_codon:yes stop_codon:yes gene_type:complete